MISHLLYAKAKAHLAKNVMQEVVIHQTFHYSLTQPT